MPYYRGQELDMRATVGTILRAPHLFPRSGTQSVLGAPCVTGTRRALHTMPGSARPVVVQSAGMRAMGSILRVARMVAK
ncbi:MAG: hypothetical protein O3A01_07485 [bacterium]|nr:hypothetical protein [bacterium]